MEIIPGLVTGGGALAIMLALVRIALGAERRRADDWRTAAQTTAKANEVQSGNIEKLVNTVDQMASTQREMMANQREMMALLQGRPSP